LDARRQGVITLGGLFSKRRGRSLVMKRKMLLFGALLAASLVLGAVSCVFRPKSTLIPLANRHPFRSKSALVPTQIGTWYLG
jgi:hypothetical protein